MKLKLRIWICSAALFVASVFTVLLCAVNFGAEVDVSGYELRHEERLLDRVYGEFGGADADADGRNSVDSLIDALRKLNKYSELADLAGPARRRPSNERSNLGAQDKPVYEQIAHRLLRDRSGDGARNVEILIKLGRTLEKSVQNNASAWNESSEMAGMWQDGKSEDVKAEESRAETSGSGKYPEFHLEDEIVKTLSQYVEKNLDRHKRLKSIHSVSMGYRLHKGTHLYNWQKWQNDINQRQLYNGTSPVVDGVLKDMAYGRITGMSTMADSGTQIKLVFKYADRGRALFKPMRWKRDQERDPNIYYFDDFERHHAEIAAFHLDRILEFYRVPPNVGRFINITAIIEPFATNSFLRTIFISPAGNKCFYGKCDYYCDSGHPVCGKPDVIEGSLAAWIPFTSKLTKKTWENPWKRSYSKFRIAEWEMNPNYCDEVKRTKPYNTGRRLLDLIDITVFDYLSGNQDRHHYHTFKIFGNNSSPVLYDNGRGFGWIHFDDATILAPLIQCCRIRFSTLMKLMRFETGPKKLSVVMADSLALDPLSSGPNGLILSEGHLKALDRRVSQILNTVWDCIQANGIARVILDDGI